MDDRSTYTINLDSTKPIHLSHTRFGASAGISIRQLWYPPEVTKPDPTLPPGTARTKRGLTVPYDDLDEFTATFLSVAYDISPSELNAAADLIDMATPDAVGEPMHISQQLRAIANAITDPEQDDADHDYERRVAEDDETGRRTLSDTDDDNLVDMDALKALFNS